MARVTLHVIFSYFQCTSLSTTDRPDATSKWQPAVFVACSALAINKRRWLRYIVNQVSVALIVSADACMQGVQGSNPADD